MKKQSHLEGCISGLKIAKRSQMIRSDAQHFRIAMSECDENKTILWCAGRQDARRPYPIASHEAAANRPLPACGFTGSAVEEEIKMCKTNPLQ